MITWKSTSLADDSEIIIETEMDTGVDTTKEESMVRYHQVLENRKHG